MKKYNIWIDVASAPQVQLYRPIIREFQQQNHQVFLTARHFSETVALAELYQLPLLIIGEHGGKTLIGKSLAIAQRTWNLSRFARHHHIDMALGHNSHAQSLTAGLLRLPLIIMTDYEHQPAHYLSLRFAHKVFVPESISAEELQKFGLPTQYIEQYAGIKEDIYLSDFVPDPTFRAEWKIPDHQLLIVMRPPATMSAYHRFENPLFYQILAWLSQQEELCLMVFPRTAEQANLITGFHYQNVIIPPKILDARQAIYAADLVIGAGGTMTREATVLGTPAYSIFAGAMGGVDQWLIQQKKLIHITTEADMAQIRLQKKPPSANRIFGKTQLIPEIVARILGVMEPL